MNGHRKEILSAMKISFLIERKNYYRLFVSIIDEALRQGWEVECWHDYNQPRTGIKGYEFPEVEAAPTFVHGKPQFKIYHGTAELKKWLLQNTVDVVVSLFTPLYYFGTTLTGTPKWISLQHSVDTFVNNSPAGILSSDLVGLYSEYWLTWAIIYFRGMGLIQSGDQIETQIAAKIVSVGFPELDQCRLIDPDEVRWQWGIPKDQPVVVFLPSSSIFPGLFWPQWRYLPLSQLSRLWWAVRQRRFKSIEYDLRGWNEINIIRAVKTFCKRNGAYLLVKSRLKEPIPNYIEALADKCLYDESYYPHTILRALSIASLCINFYSTTVTEAAYLAVPNLCIAYSPRYWCNFNCEKAILKLLLNAKEGGLFQYRGVSTTMSIPEIIKTLHHKSLGDFKIGPRARKVYIEKFLGCDDRQSSKRVLDVCRDLIAQA